MMTDAHILSGFTHGTQWLAPGVTVRVPQAVAIEWAQRGMARTDAEPNMSLPHDGCAQAAIETIAHIVEEPATPCAKPRTKKGG